MSAPTQPADSPKAGRTVRLVVTDGCPSRWMPAARAIDDGTCRWELLPVGISVDLYRMEHAAGLNTLRCWTFVDVPRCAAEARAELRRTMPQFISELRRQRVVGDKTLSELFTQGDLNIWWFLEISEKSAYRGPFLNRLYYLALIRAALAKGGYDEIWLCLQDEPLAQAIRSGCNGAVRHVRRAVIGPHIWRSPALDALKVPARYGGNALGVAVLHLLRCWLVKLLRISRRAPAAPDAFLFVSYYPAMWSNAYGLTPSEWFFGSLPETLSKLHPVQYGIWLTSQPWEIWRQRVALRRFFRERSTVILSLWAGARAIQEVLSPGHFWRAIRIVIKGRFAIRATFAGCDVARLVTEELWRSLCSREFFLDLLLMRALERLTQAHAVAAVIYRLEFQPFEKAILYGIRGRTRSIAVQHSVFGCNYLPYFFAPEDLTGMPDNPGDAMPAPDLIMTSGAMCRDAMLQSGFPPQKVAVCGPLRYSRLLQYRTDEIRRRRLRDRWGWPSTATVVYAATGVSREDGLGLLAAIAEGIASAKELVVIFKSHPALPLDEEFYRLVGPRLEPSRYRVLPLRASFYDELAAADAALVTGSTVALEAVCLGVFPILYASGASFDMKTFEPTEWGGLLVGEAEELKEALRMVVERDPSLQAMRAGWPRLVNQWFDRPETDPNARFMEALEKHGVRMAGSGRP